MANPTPRFLLGRLVATPRALRALEQSGQQPMDFVLRHVTGDWGDVGADDAGANEWALTDDGRIFSSYRTKADEKIWIITEADRSATTLLLPEEY